MNYKIITFLLVTLLLSQNNEIVNQSNTINKLDKVYNNQINPNISETILDNTINPDNYIVGPGDEFYFSMVTSNGIINQRLVVSPLGDIIIPIVGKINVDKMVLSNVFSKVERRCKEKIQNSTIDITLSKVKNFRALVLAPNGIPSGYYIVNSITRLSDIYKFINTEFQNSINNKDTLIDNENALIYKKPSLTISSRNIIIDTDQTSKTYDLLSYYYDGDEKNNPFIKHDDVIRLSYINEYIDIYGAVKVPGKYEYKKDQKLKNLIEISGGYELNADLNKIEITRYIDASEKEIIYLNSKDVASFKIMSNDEILIKPNKDYKRKNAVSIYGEVKNPGVYTIDINNKTTIKDIILRSGGYSLQADRSKIILNNSMIDKMGDQELNRILALSPTERSHIDQSYIKARARSKKGGFSNSKFDINNDQLSSYKVFDQDIIYIPTKYDFIEVIGAIKNPGRYPYNQKDNINDYIENAGGVSNNATKKYYVIQASTGDRILIKRSSNYEFKNQDIIFVEEKIESVFWDSFKDIIQVTSQLLTIITIILTVNPF